MELKHSEQFETVVGRIFEKLLESFPIPLHLEASHIGIAPQQDDRPQETLGGIGVLLDELDPTEDEEFFDQCVLWLRDECYITSGAKSHGSFGDVRLTEKALRALNAVPQCLQSGFND